MEIQSTDKLLIGRDGQSFQTDFENSGIPTKDNLDEHLHKVVGGTITGTVDQQAPVRFSNGGSVFFDDNTTIDVYQNRKITFQTGGNNRLEIGQEGINFLKGKPITFRDSSNGNLLYIDNYVGGDAVTYNGKVENDNHIATKKYVDDSIPEIPAIPDVSGFATTEYVDTEISNLGDLLVFKGTIDFTTTPAPTEFAVGHVYANSVAGTPDPSWGLTGDVSVGDLYGRGENQWGIVGSTQSEIGDFLSVYGEKVTGATEAVEYEWNENVVLASTNNQEDKGITLKSGESQLSILHDSSNRANVRLDSEFRMDFHSVYYFNIVSDKGLDLKSQDSIYLKSESNITFQSNGNVNRGSFTSRGLKLENSIESYDSASDYYRNKLVPTIEYVEHIAMPKNLNTLPEMP